MIVNTADVKPISDTKLFQATASILYGKLLETFKYSIVGIITEAITTPNPPNI